MNVQVFPIGLRSRRKSFRNRSVYRVDTLYVRGGENRILNVSEKFGRKIDYQSNLKNA